MSGIENLVASKILSFQKPGDLFSAPDAKKIKVEYLNLCKKWHPDHNKLPIANQVMAKINDLYFIAIKQVGRNTWEQTNFIKIPLVNNKALDVHYRAVKEFELGRIYFCNEVIFYSIKKKYKDFFNNYLKIVNSFRYYNSNMREEVSKYLPQIILSSELRCGSFIIGVKKPSDVYLLRDILNYYNGNIQDRHIMWILSTMYNVCCYIDYSRLSHNGITLDNYFISPKYHSGMLLGGWWYSVNQEEKMIGVSSEIYNVLPESIKNKKLGNIVTDLESIKYIGKMLLGEKNGCGIRYNKKIPVPLRDWFLKPCSKNAVEEYTNWKEVIIKSYGKREFYKMEIDDNKIYK